MTQALLQPLPDDWTKGKPLVHALAATSRRPMRVVIAGECNSGKTWLANGLLGSQVLPTSFVTRTELPTVVEFGASSRLVLEKHDGSRVATTWEDAESGVGRGRRLYCRLPSVRLKGFRLVDTPGLGDGDEGKLRRTRSLCRTADLVIWCTSALQAWKASELGFWMSLPLSVRDKGVLVLTFADMLRQDQGATRVLARLQSEAGLYFQKIVVPAQLPELLAIAGSERTGRSPQERAAVASSLSPAHVGA
jgi:predicted GTPase